MRPNESFVFVDCPKGLKEISDGHFGDSARALNIAREKLEKNETIETMAQSWPVDVGAPIWTVVTNRRTFLISRGSGTAPREH
jgi:hypothetical protein